MNILSDHGFGALGHLSFLFHDVTVKIPDIQIEDCQAFVIGLLGGVPRISQSLETPFPACLLSLAIQHPRLFYLLQVFSDGDVRS